MTLPGEGVGNSSQSILVNWEWWKNGDCIWISLYLCLRECNGTLLQYSCLENPMDGGA